MIGKYGLILALLLVGGCFEGEFKGGRDTQELTVIMALKEGIRDTIFPIPNDVVDTARNSAHRDSIQPCPPEVVDVFVLSGPCTVSNAMYVNGRNPSEVARVLSDMGCLKSVVRSLQDMYGRPIYRMPPGRWVTSEFICYWCDLAESLEDWPDSLFFLKGED